MSHCVALSPTRTEINFILRSNDQKRRIKETKEPQANESRHRDPSPHSIERYRCEGVIDSKNDKPLLEQAPRGRARSSRPSLVRAPTPYYPREEQQRDGRKGVHWTDPLEQPATENRHPAPYRRKSAMKKTDADRQKNDSVAEEEEEKDDSKDEQTGRRYKTSQIPKRKTVPKSESSSELSRVRRRPNPYPIVSTTEAPRRPQDDRPPSPLIPQEVPAPLRISPTENSLRRGHNRAIPLSVSAPEVADKSQPASARGFSFDKSEMIALAHRPVYQSQTSSLIVEISSSQPTSLLKNKPRRRGTIHATSPKPSAKPATTEHRSKVEVKTTLPIPDSLPKSSSTASFQTVKNFWGKISNNDNDTGSAAALPTPKSTPFLGSSSPKKSRIPLPVSSSVSSFHTAKSFWSEISTTSCEAVVCGPGSRPIVGSPARDSCRKSKVAEVARYTVNTYRPLRKSGWEGGAVGHGAGSKSVSGVTKYDGVPKISSRGPSSSVKRHVNVESSRSSVSCAGSKAKPKPNPSDCSAASGSKTSISTTTGSSSSSTSYQTAKSHLSAASGASASATSNEAQYSPTVQSELWNDIMRFCSSDMELSSCPRFCDCDDCLWGETRDDAGCSTVARVGGGNCSGSARRR